MATISNTPRPGYVWDATDNVWYPIGVGGHSHSEIAKTIADAKGDLIVGTAADTVDRLAVGNNGETLVADSSTSTGLRYQGNQAAGKNSIINGGFDIWQRGTSFVPTTTAFGPDRWQVYRNTTGSTASRQTPGSTLPQFQYCARMQRDSGTTAVNSASYAMSLETSESLKYAGQTVTLSFYARAGANFSGSGASAMRIYLMYGTGTDQNEISGFTGNTFLVNGTVTAITTSWVRYSFTVAVSSTATQLGLELNALFSGTAGAADYFEVTGVQLELGSVATTFSRAGGTIQGELAACQRYYQKTFDQGTTPGNAVTPNGQVYFTRQATSGTVEPSLFVKISPTMRTAPSVTLYNPYLSTAGQWSDGSTNSANARTINSSDSGITIDNTDVAITGQNFGIHYALSAEL